MGGPNLGFGRAKEENMRGSKADGRVTSLEGSFQFSLGWIDVQTFEDSPVLSVFVLDSEKGRCFNYLYMPYILVNIEYLFNIYISALF